MYLYINCYMSNLNVNLRRPNAIITIKIYLIKRIVTIDYLFSIYIKLIYKSVHMVDLWFKITKHYL